MWLLIIHLYMTDINQGSAFIIASEKECNAYLDYFKSITPIENEMVCREYKSGGNLYDILKINKGKQ